MAKYDYSKRNISDIQADILLLNGLFTGITFTLTYGVGDYITIEPSQALNLAQETALDTFMNERDYKLRIKV